MSIGTICNNTDAAREALSAAWHLACTEGADRGAVCALPSPSSREALTFGRACPAVSDPGASREHLIIRTDTSGARLYDPGSANGTVLRRRCHRLRLRPRQARRLRAGQSVEVGGSRWELRRRPTRFALPLPAPHPSAISISGTQPLRAHMMPLVAGAMLVLSLAFSLRRMISLWDSSSGYLPVVVITVAVTLICALTVWMWGRQRRRNPVRVNMRLWHDPAAVLLSLAHRAQHGQHKSPHTSSSPVILMSPSADHGRPVRLVCDLWNEAGLASQVEEAEANTRYCRFPVFYGETALLNALYFAAFVCLPAGGGTVICDSAIPGFAGKANGSEPLTLCCGNGSEHGAEQRVIHCISSTSCRFCREHFDPSIAHIGVARNLGQLGAWWDYPIAVQAPVSWTWVEQCFHPPTAGSEQQNLPECVDARDLDDAMASLPQPRGSLSACIGLGDATQHALGPVTVDLATQGPHAVIVGSTGSGKSVALLTWILSLATRYSPDHLRMVLIDYKGGATCAALAPLPHVEAVLTDLHPARTQRALLGVRTLLRQREHALAQAGFSDLSQWEAAAQADGATPPPPPRVLLACDEFTALSSQHPEAFSLLMSLAAQGRSLGLHILLATQRPDQSLTPGLLANIDLRLALRCREESASQLLVGSAAAAQLPRIPGRAILSDHGPIQCAWIPDIAQAVSDVRQCWQERSDTQLSSAHTPDPLWADELPEALSWADLPLPSPTHGLPFGLVDGITRGEHDVLYWVGGHIRIEGTRRNDAHIATSVRAMAHRIACHLDLPLHVCTIAPETWSALTPSGSFTPPTAHVTSLIPCADSSSVALLLHEAGTHGPCVIAIEDQSALLRALERDLGVGVANGVWSHFLHNAAANDIILVIGHPEQPSLWDREAGSMSYRLLVAHHEHELQRIGATRAHPTEPYPGRYLLLNAPEHSHVIDERSAADSYAQVQIPLQWHSEQARHHSSKVIEPSWRVRSPQLLPRLSSTQALAQLAESAASPRRHKEAPQLSTQARLRVGTSLEVATLPEAHMVTIIAEEAHLYAKALGLSGESGNDGATLLSPHEWSKLTVSAPPFVLAFRVRDEVGRALSLTTGGAEPWIIKCSQDWDSGILMRNGKLERCLIVGEELPR